MKLISYTPNPERIIATAAKLCYSAEGIEKIEEGLNEDNVANFISMLTEIGHESPIEHVSFTFSIENVSRALLAQLTRHRIASYSVKSQRYVNEGQFNFIIPPEIESVAEAKEEFIKAMNEDMLHYERISGILKNKYKKCMIEEGIDEKIANKISEKKAIEDARFVLPNACETKIICTFNARSLMNLFLHRCCNRAQWEIREVAIEMLRLVSKAAPNLFKKAGPPCLFGTCPEGKMSCGDPYGVRERFKKIKGEQ